MDHADSRDILERLGDVVLSWSEKPNTPPSKMIEVRADLITASYAGIERLRSENTALKHELEVAHNERIDNLKMRSP